MAILHIVQIKFRETINERQIANFFADFEKHANTFLGVSEFQVKPNMTQQSALSPFDHCMTFKFADADIRNQFLNAPKTQAITYAGMSLVENPPASPLDGPADASKPCGVCVVDIELEESLELA